MNHPAIVTILHPITFAHVEGLDDTAFQMLDRFAVGIYADNARGDDSAFDRSQERPSRKAANENDDDSYPPDHERCAEGMIRTILQLGPLVDPVCVAICALLGWAAGRWSLMGISVDRGERWFLLQASSLTHRPVEVAESGWWVA